ncbi:hypothetical protein [Goekera deserti]|uniref:Uncharacterized protein n=1 Tax=Goekera deserti TaxID=2497753 RepID=A0A7K3WKR9_9ACTN|nr:hypothetical protein [Goekera deserti]NDI47293.1 hypothetical protein [Goekera deserti]NEL56123.1 hypothetical protein [Goekera deserti]
MSRTVDVHARALLPDAGAPLAEFDVPALAESRARAQGLRALVVVHPCGCSPG